MKSESIQPPQRLPEPGPPHVSSTLGNEGNFSLRIDGIQLTLNELGLQLKEAIKNKDEQAVLRIQEERAILSKELARLSEMRLAKCPFDCQNCRTLKEK